MFKIYILRLFLRGRALNNILPVSPLPFMFYSRLWFWSVSFIVVPIVVVVSSLGRLFRVYPLALSHIFSHRHSDACRRRSGLDLDLLRRPGGAGGHYRWQRNVQPALDGDLVVLVRRLEGSAVVHPNNRFA